MSIAQSMESSFTGEVSEGSTATPGAATNQPELVVASQPTPAAVKSEVNQEEPGATQSSEQVPELSDDDIEVDVSSDSESESSSSSDSESDAQDEESVKSDDEEDQITGPIASKHEILDEEAPTLPDDYQIDDSAPIELVGEIKSIIDGSIVITGNVSGEFRVLKENSVLCLEDKTVLGPLFEIFGRLQSPIFRIKYNDHQKAEKFREFIGHKVYYVVPDSQFVLTDSIKSMRGTDASNCHDEELPEEEQEYSDDEREQQAKQSKKKKRKAKDNESQKKKKPDSDGNKPLFQPYGYADNRIPEPKNNPPAQAYNETGYQPQTYSPQIHTTQAYVPPPQAYGQPQQAPYGQPQQIQYGPPQNAAANGFGGFPQNHYSPYVQNQFQPQPPFNAYPNQAAHAQPPVNHYSTPYQPNNAFVPPQMPTNYGQFPPDQIVDPAKQLDNLNPEQLQQLKQMLINQLQQQSNNNERPH